MEPPCVNLREQFGRRFKITYEESYVAAYGLKAGREDAWLQIIPGARGHVYPHSAAMVAASTNTSGPTARRLKVLPFVQVWTDGSDGVTVLFPPEHLERVADLLGLRRRRRRVGPGAPAAGRAGAEAWFPAPPSRLPEQSWGPGIDANRPGRP